MDRLYLPASEGGTGAFEIKTFLLKFVGSWKLPLAGNDKIAGCYFAVIPHQPCLTITHYLSPFITIHHDL